MSEEEGLVDAFESLELHPVRLRMKHRFRRVDHRELVLIHGPSGWGEFSPFPEYSPQISARWLASALESACTPWPVPVREIVPVNVTVPAVEPATAYELVSSSGCSTAKVKVADPGDSEARDTERLDAVRDALGPDGKIRIDVNGAWDVQTAVRRIGDLERIRLEYVEQPVATIEEMKQVRDAVEVPIAADESIRFSSHPMEVVEAGAADILVLKVQPLGGVARTLELARRSGTPVVLSSALESSIGMSAGVRAAAALDDLPYACGLATVTLLIDDVVRDRLVPNEGFIADRRPEPDPELLEEFRPDRERAGEMLRKVRAAAELLT